MPITERRTYFVKTVNDFRKGMPFRDIGPAFEKILRASGIDIECVISAVELDDRHMDNVAVWEVVARCPIGITWSAAL